MTLVVGFPKTVDQKSIVMEFDECGNRLYSYLDLADGKVKVTKPVFVDLAGLGGMELIQ